MKLTKAIGIISYFPEDQEIKRYRKNKLINLIIKFNELFNIPILIVAQNYTEFDIKDISLKNVKLFLYPKLGITLARNTLRKIFLETSYDYIIMCDDDTTISGSSGTKYLEQIDNNPGCFIENNRSRLQLFAISKELFELQDFENVNPENAEGFEDRIFYNRLLQRFPEKHRKFQNTGLTEYSIATADRNSTWYTNQDLTKMLEKTKYIISNKRE